MLLACAIGAFAGSGAAQAASSRPSCAAAVKYERLVFSHFPQPPYNRTTFTFSSSCRRGIHGSTLVTVTMTTAGSSLVQVEAVYRGPLGLESETVSTKAVS